MLNVPDILSVAYNQNLMQDDMTLLQEKVQQIPGSVQYTIKRYHRNLQWNIEDTGMMVYNYEKKNRKENYLELRFCF